MGVGQGLMALDDLIGPAYELVLVDGRAPEESAAAWRSIEAAYLPNVVVARRAHSQEDPSIAPILAATLAGKKSLDGQPTLYVCERGTCRPPVAGVAAIEETIRALGSGKL